MRAPDSMRGKVMTVPSWRAVLPVLVIAVTLGAFSPVSAAPEGPWPGGGTIPRPPGGLDPAKTGAIIPPFMVLYGPHAARVKPMPAGLNTPSLAESWTESKDGLVYEFVLRKGVKFHNGDPVTAADVKFSFERYKGAGAKLLKERVRQVHVMEPGRI